MALLTLTDMLAEYRDNTMDADSANYSISDAIATRLLNRCYAIVRGLQDDRPHFVSASTSGASFAPVAGSGYMVLLQTNYRRILQVYPAANNTSVLPLGPPLAKWTPEDLFRMQVEDPTDRAIYASAYAAWRAGTVTAASVGKWNLGLWPLSSVTYDYLLQVLKEITALAAGTDKPDTSETETHVVVDMASAVGLRLQGRDEEAIRDVKERVPQIYQAALDNIAADLGMAAAAPQKEVA